MLSNGKVMAFYRTNPISDFQDIKMFNLFCFKLLLKMGIKMRIKLALYVFYLTIRSKALLRPVSAILGVSDRFHKRSMIFFDSFRPIVIISKSKKRKKNNCTINDFTLNHIFFIVLHSLKLNVFSLLILDKNTTENNF